MAVKNIGQWEVVGGGKTSKVKSKPAPVKNGVPTKSGSTTFAPPTLKVEELGTLWLFCDPVVFSNDY